MGFTLKVEGNSTIDLGKDSIKDIDGSRRRSF